jgi:REP element-mobilizing transposase RayT
MLAPLATIFRVRTPRIKVPAEEAEATYHCMSRTVNLEWLFDDTAKEVMRRHLWQVADFCGVKIITHHLLSNHFHVLVRIPQKSPVSDAELLRRYRVLHPSPTKYQALRLEVIESWLRSNVAEGEAWRQRMLKLMGDLSAFMKLFKQRYTIAFNRSHGRCGPLWCDRFKSVLCEGTGEVLRAMALYIDLNSVRAGLTSDPKDYRFGGYAEAVAGNVAAREGLASVCGGKDWAETQAIYRKFLFGTGIAPRRDGGVISVEEFKRVVAAGGRLPLADVLRCRVRYFTEGAVLGGRAFVQAHLAAYRLRTGRRRNTAAPSLPPLADCGDLSALRSVRGPAFG